MRYSAEGKLCGEEGDFIINGSGYGYWQQDWVRKNGMNSAERLDSDI